MEMWHVYQLHSDIELLYVGYTRRLKCRLREHARQRPWWPEVTDVQSEGFATEDEARQREKELWAGGRPKYNKHSPFRTQEERREYWREYNRSPLGRARDRANKQTLKRQQWQKEYDQSPKRREVVSRYRAKVARRSQQAGPGLF